jgi:DmsE family decaheme c-type cytochrome
MPRYLFFATLLFFGAFCASDVLAAPACNTCHSDSAATVRAGVHAKSGPEDCTVCHGDGTEHLAAPTSPGSILTFALESAAERSAPCMACHQDARVPAAGNPHHQAGLACDDCHSVHADKARAELPAAMQRLTPGSTACYACHEDTFAQFAFSERHRLIEGSVSCTSCHDPHEPDTRRHLGGFKQMGCATCHADAGGPFVFEHPASRLDGCTACHVPHGSPNRHLLTHQRVGELCYSCHAVVPQFHLGFAPVGGPRFDENTVCTNCHVSIHGSNLDRSLLR